MDYDDFERMMKQKQAERFNEFRDNVNDILKEKGETRTFEDFVNPPKPESPPQPKPELAHLEELFVELRKETTDESFQDITTRALGIYRSIVRHIRAGGSVKFVAADGTDKTLKVRLR